jgi:hypothetical protein
LPNENHGKFPFERRSDRQNGPAARARYSMPAAAVKVIDGRSCRLVRPFANLGFRTNQKMITMDAKSAVVWGPASNVGRESDCKKLFFAPIGNFMFVPPNRTGERMLSLQTPQARALAGAEQSSAEKRNRSSSI